jgi:hypothetical protein
VDKRTDLGVKIGRKRIEDEKEKKRKGMIS